MLNYIEKIREISERLLTEGRVDAVIGYEKGSAPAVNRPCIIREAGEVDRLVWDSNCRLNLSTYLSGRTEKIGIVAKGCDSRNIVNLILENRVKREDLVIIGIPCKGMNDRHGVLQRNCSVCTHRNPVIHDELAAEPVGEQEAPERFADVNRVESMTTDERWEFFEGLLSSCTRCYACRNACPMCFCPTCFVDESTPQWVGKGDDGVDVRTYHFLRAFHLSGRCTDCGACEAACPMDIQIRYLSKKLEKDCLDRFGLESGLSTDVLPALDTFRPDDPEDFIR